MMYYVQKAAHTFDLHTILQNPGRLHEFCFREQILRKPRHSFTGKREVAVVCKSLKCICFLHKQTSNSSASGRITVDDQDGGHELDLQQIIELIEAHQSNSSLCCDEDAVFFVGNTGAGKSTTVNYLAGRRIVTVRDADMHFVERLEVENPLDGCTVGYTGNSETRYLRSYFDSSSDPHLVLCDTPGFDDTEGSDIDIANAVAIAWAIRQSKTVRLVLVIESSSILSTRGNELSRLFTLFKRFLVNIEETVQSVILFVSCFEQHFFALNNFY